MLEGIAAALGGKLPKQQGGVGCRVRVLMYGTIKDESRPCVKEKPARFLRLAIFGGYFSSANLPLFCGLSTTIYRIPAIASRFVNASRAFFMMTARSAMSFGSLALVQTLWPVHRLRAWIPSAVRYIGSLSSST